MADALPDEDGVVVHAPDLTMKKKLGPGKSLGAIITPVTVERTEKVVANFEPEIVKEILAEFSELENIATHLKPNTTATSDLKIVIEKGFAIKSKAGFCNYSLASSLARFMHLFCETLLDKQLTIKDISIISCFVSILKIIFERKIMGDGGSTGNTIVQEAQRMISLTGLPPA